MNIFKAITTVVALSTASLIAASAHAAIPMGSNGKPVAGQTAEQFLAYKRQCPECVKVAEDVVKMRAQYCRQATTVDSTILQDPLYPYLNSIRLVTEGQGGYNSTIYSSARQIVEANVNCDDSNDWLDRSKKVLSNTYGFDS